MDHGSVLGWEPPSSWMRLTVIDSHTGGEPFRVVVDGLPDIPGNTVLARRRHAMQHLDHLRRMLMWEPRGHSDMYGGWLGPPMEPGSDLSVLFTHNDGFSTMCGHGIIALTKVVLDTGIVAPDRPTIRIDTPAGTVSARATSSEGLATQVSFENVPSFVDTLDLIVDVEGWGEVSCDVAFGGAYYAFVDGPSHGVDMTDLDSVIRAGRAIKRAVMEQNQVVHPTQPDLGFLYGVIFTGPAHTTGRHSRHVCVFAEGEVDRSPTGTGVSARLAILSRRGGIEVGETIAIESIVGSMFTGRIDGETEVAGVPAVVPVVTGTAHILGRHEVWIDPTDRLGAGFMLR